MKKTLLIMASGLLLAGCVAEAPYIDKEFGMATRDAFDSQIVHKDGQYADKSVEGMPGIHAEKVMETYHETFSEGFTQEDVDITQTGK